MRRRKRISTLGCTIIMKSTMTFWEKAGWRRITQEPVTGDPMTKIASELSMIARDTTTVVDTTRRVAVSKTMMASSSVTSVKDPAMTDLCDDNATVTVVAQIRVHRPDRRIRHLDFSHKLPGSAWVWVN
jgi:hypothetical protein